MKAWGSSPGGGSRTNDRRFKFSFSASLHRERAPVLSSICSMKAGEPPMPEVPVSITAVQGS